MKVDLPELLVRSEAHEVRGAYGRIIVYATDKGCLPMSHKNLATERGAEPY